MPLISLPALSYITVKSQASCSRHEVQPHSAICGLLLQYPATWCHITVFDTISWTRKKISPFRGMHLFALTTVSQYYVCGHMQPCTANRIGYFVRSEKEKPFLNCGLCVRTVCVLGHSIRVWAAGGRAGGPTDKWCTIPRISGYSSRSVLT